MSIRPGLLALLAGGPKHGYQLKVEFESATGGIWKLNVGQVYTTLDRLSRDGCVVAELEGDQKRYAITAAGREELARWWQAQPGEEPPPRDELVVKVLLSIAGAPETAVHVVTGQRTALTEVLQRRRQAGRAEARPDDTTRALAMRLAADAVIVRTEAQLRWLDLCEARLLEHRRTADHNAENATYKEAPR